MIFPLNTSIYKGFSKVMLNNQMVSNNKCGIYMMLRTCIELKNPSPANLRDMPCDKINHAWKVPIVSGNHPSNM
jgi:hypothetical protein